MAKAGFWLRGARGKLAGATIYKGSNGTVMREIVSPRNPKTDRQMYQRAIMATVMRVYSLGSEIFDHSFEGKAVGMESMNYFRSINSKRLRTILIADSKNNTLNGHVVAPGTKCAVPNTYIVSEGTYNQDFMILNVLAQSANVVIPEVGDAPTLGAYATANELVEGDIYTFLAILTNENKIVYQGDEGGGSSVYDSQLLYVQFKVKDGALDDATAMAEDTPVTALFDIEGNLSSQALASIKEAVFSDQFLVDTASLVSGEAGYTTGAVGVIRSHEDTGLRSNTILQYFGSDDLGGITYEHIIPEWKKATSSLGNSSLILEGINYSGNGQEAHTLALQVLTDMDEESRSYGRKFPMMVASDGLILPYVESEYEDEGVVTVDMTCFASMQALDNPEEWINSVNADTSQITYTKSVGYSESIENAFPDNTVIPVKIGTLDSGAPYTEFIEMLREYFNRYI